LPAGLPPPGGLTASGVKYVVFLKVAPRGVFKSAIGAAHKIGENCGLIIIKVV
jgi:hypothetical protein